MAERLLDGTGMIFVLIVLCLSDPLLTAVSLCTGKIVSNIEQFGQYPLQVNGFNNLDECLEGAMVEGEIESLHSDQKVPTSQEVRVFCHNVFDLTLF